MIPSVTLNNGVEMPLLGLGLYAPRHNSEVQQAVEWAIGAGCRLFDTAAAYGNEHEVGQALKNSGLPRSEVFVTTKVWNDDQGFESTLRAFDRSLEKLGLDTVDLYLVHWPVGQTRRATWQALERLYAEGRTRAIGLSNYYPPHLTELDAYAEVVPAVNQIEFSPYCYLPEVLEACRARGIQPEGYAPLVRGLKKDDPPLVKIAEKWGKTTFQVLVRWSLQHGVVTIPKSVKQARIRENFEVLDFSLDAADMAQLDALFDNTRIAWHPLDFA